MSLDAPTGELVGAAELKAVMGHFATGVAIVTAVEDDGPVGFSCQSFVSLSLDPPLIALAPSKGSTSWPKIARAGIFCVNILAEGQHALCHAFAVSGGDKFAGVPWSPTSRGAPRIEGSLAWVECELELVHDAGDHELVLGRVIALGHHDGVPLLYYRSTYATLLSSS